MESGKRNAVKGFALGLTVVCTVACSQTKFTDGSLGKLDVPTGPQQEQFDFNDSNAQAKVDILIVDDNSASMLERQQKMAARMGPFIATLGNIDWQIGITTTDTSDGPWGIKGSFIDLKGATGNVLSRYTPNYGDVFKATIVRDETANCPNPDAICPSSDERPLQAIVEAIGKRNTDNVGFFRDSASLAVIILSDEDESYALAPNIPVPPQMVVNTVRAVFGPNKTFATYGIINRPEDQTCVEANTLNSGDRHPSIYAEELIKLTGGVTGSVCDTDYVTALSAIGKSLSTNASSITLRGLPIPESVKIKIEPYDPDLTYVLSGSQIIFNHLPKKGTRVTVEYIAH